MRARAPSAISFSSCRPRPGCSAPGRKYNAPPVLVKPGIDQHVLQIPRRHDGQGGPAAQPSKRYSDAYFMAPGLNPVIWLSDKSVVMYAPAVNSWGISLMPVSGKPNCPSHSR